MRWIISTSCRPPRRGVGGSWRSVLAGEHDRENASGHARIGGIRRPVLQVAVASTFQKDAMAVVLEGAEIVLAIRVIRRSEIVVGTNALQDCCLIFDRQGSDAARHKRRAVGEEHPGLVVELAYPRKLGIGNHKGELVKAGMGGRPEEGARPPYAAVDYRRFREKRRPANELGSVSGRYREQMHRRSGPETRQAPRTRRSSRLRWHCAQAPASRPPHREQTGTRQL